MSAEVGEAVLLRQREAGFADDALRAAAVDHDRLFSDFCAVFLQVFHRRAGIDRDQNEVTACQRILGQLAVHRALQHCKVQHLAVDVRSQNLPARGVVRLGERAADQAESNNPDFHAVTTFRISATFFASSSYCSGRSDCAPSQRAWMGSL